MDLLACFTIVINFQPPLLLYPFEDIEISILLFCKGIPQDGFSESSSTKATYSLFNGWNFYTIRLSFLKSGTAAT